MKRYLHPPSRTRFVFLTTARLWLHALRDKLIQIGLRDHPTDVPLPSLTKTFVEALRGLRVRTGIGKATHNVSLTERHPHTLHVMLDALGLGRFGWRGLSERASVLTLDARRVNLLRDYE